MTRFAVLALLPVLALGACSEAESIVDEAASDATRRAGCIVAESAVDQGRSLVEAVTGEIRTDPEAARRELTAVREALSTAEQGLSGGAREQLARAGDAIDDLRAEAQSAADGATVDDRAVEAARGEYDAAVDELTSLC